MVELHSNFTSFKIDLRNREESKDKIENQDQNVDIIISGIVTHTNNSSISFSF